MTSVVVKQHPEFSAWLRGLKDAATRGIIAARIKRVQSGLLGDVNAVGDGVSELKIDHGPGWRVYFKRHGEAVIVLLVGGSKSSQSSDILKAKKLASQLDFT